MSWHFQAFSRLATCRTMNGDIPYTAVACFAERNGIEGHAFDELLDTVEMFEALNRAWQDEVKQAQEEQKADVRTH